MKHIQHEKTFSTLTEVREQDIQPNAVDLRIDQVYEILTADFMINADDVKVHHPVKLIEPTPCMPTGFQTSPNEIDPTRLFWRLVPGSYQVLMKNTVKVAENEAGWIVPRSSLVRNGMFITSGLYDSGYEGLVGGCLHVRVGNAMIERGSRIGQFLLFDAQMMHKYAGSYGVGKEYDKNTYMFKA